MKHPGILLLLMLSTPADSHAQDVNVMTFNIRLNIPSDEENAWPHRKEMAASQILFHQTHLLGVQEALPDQMEDLAKLLPGYKHIGVARDTGSRGEFSAIFYDTSVMELLRSETFWLSETPSVPNKKGWDAALPRIVTWGEFKDKRTGRTFYMFNTHFDHVGVEARKNSALLLTAAVDSLAKGRTGIVTGDFNATPQDTVYAIMTDSSRPTRLIDAKYISASGHYGPTGTFNAFGPKEVNDLPIDYIFVTPGVQVLQHATLSQTWGGKFSSDHFPVFARLRL